MKAHEKLYQVYDLHFWILTHRAVKNSLYGSFIFRCHIIIFLVIFFSKSLFFNFPGQNLYHGFNHQFWPSGSLLTSIWVHFLSFVCSKRVSLVTWLFFHFYLDGMNNGCLNRSFGSIHTLIGVLFAYTGKMMQIYVGGTW